MPSHSTRIEATSSHRPLLYRLAAGLIVLTIVTLVPTARMLTMWVKATITKHEDVFNTLTTAFAFPAIAVVLWYFNYSRKVFSPLLWLLHAFSLVVPVAIAYTLITHPTELAHIPMYAFLALFVTLSFKNPSLPLTPLKAFAMSWSMGVTDELLQWLHPERFCDWHDIAINTCAVLTGILIAEPLRRGSTPDTISSQSSS